MCMSCLIYIYIYIERDIMHTDSGPPSGGQRVTQGLPSAISHVAAHVARKRGETEPRPSVSHAPV